MRRSRGTRDLASPGHSALKVHSELLKLKQWRAVLAGHTFVIFVTQEGSCGYFRQPMDYGGLFSAS